MLSEICRYKAAFLADRPAETHQLTLSDASLNTRWEAIQRVRPQARREKNGERPGKRESDGWFSRMLGSNKND